MVIAVHADKAHLVQELVEDNVEKPVRRMKPRGNVARISSEKACLSKACITVRQ